MNRALFGDCREVMKALTDSGLQVDSIVTDPPYELTQSKRGGTGMASLNPNSPAGRSRVTTGFMGLGWDATGASFDLELWRLALSLLKPGGHLLAFGGSRTYHRLACAIENAGFEIRDQIQWIYGSGFPKSLDVSKAIDKAAGIRGDVISEFKGTFGINERRVELGYRPKDVRPGTVTAPATDEAKQWEGWGTALKPAHEPIVVARKPLSEKTVAANVLKYGTGAINIDGCRVPTAREILHTGSGGLLSHIGDGKPYPRGREGEDSAHRRYAGKGGTNFAATPGPRGGSEKGRWPANIIHDGSDEVVDKFPKEAGGAAPVRGTEPTANGFSGAVKFGGLRGRIVQSDTFRGDSGSAARFFYCAKASPSERGTVKHPTIKPIALMRYLCRLVTPPGGTVLDPFAGSGTTGLAALEEGFGYVLIEKDATNFAEMEERLRTAQAGLPL